jgi:adenine-specific DNA-methyltransferase
MVYKGKIDLIYIDPPYNTGSDSFGYNDNFNQSTWLTFMKNRLEVAKSLLSKSGVIMVQCSFHQFAFLKILMLDIFNKHLCDFNIQVRHPDRSLTGDKEYNDVIEYVLIFSNDENKKMPYKEEIKTIDDYIIKIAINENEKPFDIINCDGKEVEVYKPEQYNVITTEPNKDSLKRISIRGSIREKNSSGRFFVKHLEHLKNVPAQTLFKVPDMGDDADNHRYFYSAPEGKKNGGYYQGKPTSSNITKKQYSNFYNFEKDYNNVAKQGGVSFRNGKKPEELMKFLIETFTQENAIVLDYHLGSGTTAATSHKLNRRYIGIEQMDYIEDIAVNRIVNVINGDEEGISKAINWKGGGSFVYFELAKNNYKYVDLINNATTGKELINVWNTLNNNQFISFKINLSEYVNETAVFKSLEIEVQKNILLSCLDKNQLYVNYSDINDIEHKCSKEDISLNSKFYIQ